MCVPSDTDKLGAGMYNGLFQAAFRVHGPQQVHRAETMACAITSNMAQEGDEIINKGVVKHLPREKAPLVIVA